MCTIFTHSYGIHIAGIELNAHTWFRDSRGTTHHQGIYLYKILGVSVILSAHSTLTLHFIS